MKEKNITACGETKTSRQWAKELGVSASWICILDSKGEFEDRLRDGRVGSRKQVHIPIGTRIGNIEILGPDKPSKGYRTYRVRNVVSGKETVARATMLADGTFKGRYIKNKLTPPEGHPLANIYIKHFAGGDEFKSWEDFENWAADRGYSAENRWIWLKDKSRGYTRENVYFRKNGILFTYDGITDNMSGWAKRLGVSAESVRQQYRKGKLGEYLKRKLPGSGTDIPDLTSSHG